MSRAVSPLAHSSPWNSSRTGPVHSVSACSSAPSLSAVLSAFATAEQNWVASTSPSNEYPVLVVRSVAGPMVARSRDTVVLSAPVVTPRTSASHSARNCRGACTARSPSSRRWLALGTSMIDPSGVTPHTAPSTCTEAGVASW